MGSGVGSRVGSGVEAAGEEALSGEAEGEGEGEGLLTAEAVGEGLGDTESVPAELHPVQKRAKATAAARHRRKYPAFFFVMGNPSFFSKIISMNFHKRKQKTVLQRS